ncbi:MAG: PIN domain-containing protein, partial [Kiritimatiellaeota bacterium]|nr:PIN domain-containing protein [Kiritimatiellota bacterium]
KKIISTHGITVYSPLLMEVEVLGSMARKTRDNAKVDYVWKRMRSLSRQVWLPLDTLLTAEASRCATTFYLRGADAVYVAIAMANNATLVTFDQEIIDRASTALAVLKPSQWLEACA